MPARNHIQTVSKTDFFSTLLVLLHRGFDRLIFQPFQDRQVFQSNEEFDTSRDAGLAPDEVGSLES